MNHTGMEPHILALADDAAPLLAMTPRRLVKLVKAGKVPFVDLGDGEIRFSLAALRRWAEQQQSSTAATQQEASPCP